MVSTAPPDLAADDSIDLARYRSDMRLPRGSGGGLALVSIAITPSPLSVLPGDTVQLTATGTYSDSSTLNLTSAVTWSTSNSNIATVSSGTTGGPLHRITGAAFDVTATLGAISATVSKAALTPTISSISPTHGTPTDAITVIGTNLDILTACDFNGAACGFVMISATEALLTVPNGATDGHIHVTNPYGSATSAQTFTVDANPFAFDLTSGNVPTGVTVTRTGSDTFYLQRGSSTPSVVASTAVALFEDRDDGHGMGLHSFAAYYNAAPNPFDIRAGTGWTEDGTITTAAGLVGPDGSILSTLLTDPSAVVASYVTKTGSGAPANDVYGVTSAWFKDNVNNPPTVDAVLYDAAHYKDTGSGSSTWRRVWSVWTKSSGATLYEQVAVFPAGGDPAPTAVGGVHVWGASAVRQHGRPPLVNGSTGKCIISATTPSDARLPNGDLFIEGRYINDPSFPVSPYSSNITLGSIQTAAGISALRWNAIGTTFVGYFNDGATFGDENPGNQLYDKEVKWQLFSIAGQSAGFNLWYGGCRFAGQSNVARTSPVVIGAITGAWLGSRIGTDEILPRLMTAWKRNTVDPEKCELILMGDSEIAAYGSGLMTGAFIYTQAEARTRDGILSMAYPGQRVDQIKQVWDNSPQLGQSYVKGMIIQLGINDIDQGASAATTISRLQSLVNDINTNNATAKIILSPLTPARAYLGDTKYAVWQAVNTAIAGGGGSPITGSNLSRIAPWAALNDGSGNLLSQYDQGDGLHVNQDGRESIQAPAFRAAFVVSGLLP